MKKRFYVFIDTESVVAEDEHVRYQAMERFTPRKGQRDSGRRGQRGRNDPLTNPRWMFQEIKVASVLVCGTHDDGNIVPVSFDTFSAAKWDEKAVLQQLFAVVDSLPTDTELVSYGGAWADVPRLLIRAMKHDLQLPRPWRSWVQWGGQGRTGHIDLMRLLTGSSKMTASHMSEFAAVIGLPAKMTAAPWAAAELIRRGEWRKVEEMCEADCVTTALLFARWRRTFDGPSADIVEDRICRVIEELCPGRGYIPALNARRREIHDLRVREAWQRLEDREAA